MTTPLAASQAYIAAGISVIPIATDGSKAPDWRSLPREPEPETGRFRATWKPYQQRLPTEEEQQRWFGTGTAGVATIGGAVSGHLEQLDFDTRALEIFPRWCELVESEAPGLTTRLCIVRTPRPGFAVRYRCPEIEIPGNTKLAEDPSLPPKQRCLIETRGEGGYAIAPGSPASCHETGRTYEHHSGPKLSQVQEITAAERDVLIRCARSFDLSGSQTAGCRPGDAYDQHGPDWADILTPHGWQLVRTDGAVCYWRRPDKDRGSWSATTGYCKGPNKEPLLKVFSTDASPFEGGKVYGKFRAFALLNHNGDLSAAARALAEKGFGDGHKANGHGPNPHEQRQTTVEPWPLPRPLAPDSAVPSFPTHTLPTWLRDWVECVAEATQTPPALPALLSLAVCGAAIAGRFRVVVRDGWSEPANLFTVVALPPGDRKSAVFAEAIRPVQAFEAEELERTRTVIAEAASEHRVLEARLKVTELKAAKEENAVERDCLRHEAKQIARELAAHTVPDAPQFYCDDVTPEKLGNLLARQGGRILQAAAEGTAFEIAKGRYSESANFDIYLKGHAGDQLRIDRISREGDLVENPALSVALAVQPDVIRGLAEQTSLRGRGFLARFLYAIPISRVGGRAIRPRPVPKAVANRYQENVLRLWRLSGYVDEHGKQAAHLIPFSPAADAALAALEEWLEPQLAEGEDLSYLAGWANKLAGAVARIALALHLAAATGEQSPWQQPVAEDTVQAAIEIGRDYLLPHAKAAFGLMGTDERVADAQAVVARLPRLCESCETSERGGTLSRRDIHQAFRARFKTVEDLYPVLKILEEYEYLRPIPPPKENTTGRPPSPRYAVNPALLQPRARKTPPPAQNAQNAQNVEGDPGFEDTECSENGAALGQQGDDSEVL